MVSFIRFAPQEAMSCCIAFKHPEVGDSWNPMRPVQCQTSKSLKGANHPSSDFFLSSFRQDSTIITTFQTQKKILYSLLN